MNYNLGNKDLKETTWEYSKDTINNLVKVSNAIYSTRKDVNHD